MNQTRWFVFASWAIGLSGGWCLGRAINGLAGSIVGLGSGAALASILMSYFLKRRGSLRIGVGDLLATAGVWLVSGAIGGALSYGLIGLLAPMLGLLADLFGYAVAGFFTGGVGGTVTGLVYIGKGGLGGQRSIGGLPWAIGLTLGSTLGIGIADWIFATVLWSASPASGALASMALGGATCGIVTALFGITSWRTEKTTLASTGGREST